MTVEPQPPDDEDVDYPLGPEVEPGEAPQQVEVPGDPDDEDEEGEQ